MPRAGTLVPVAVAVGLVAGLATAPASAVAQEQPVAGVVPIQVTGPPSERFNLVIMGDGYTAGEMAQYRADVEHHLNVQWSIEPFRSYRNYLNVYSVEIESPESGVSCDPEPDSPRRETPLSMAFWGGCNPDSVRRLLSVDGAAANAFADLVPGVAPQNRQLLALANSATYGGAGGTNATASARNALSALISPHELGHSLGNLQDEYPYFARNTTLGEWDGGEPGSIHHTTLTTGEMRDGEAKWWRWLGEESASGGTIDRYEGGMYHNAGVWHPSRNSIMRSLGYYYDQVSRERMTVRISGLRDRRTLPVTSTPEGEVGPTDVLWVEVPHPAHHALTVTWFVDGEEVAGTHNGRNLPLAGLDVASGDTVSVRVQDPTEFVRDPALRASPAMTQTREWTVGTPLPPAEVEVEITSARPGDRPVAADEVVYVETSHPIGRVLDVTWTLDGEELPTPMGGRDLDLGALDLAPGTYELAAAVTDPADPGGASDSRRWTVDNTPPAAPATLSAPLAVGAGPAAHPIYFDGLTMALDPRDDQPGIPVAEFRVGADGWHHYYGHPDDSTAPFPLTHSGFNVDDLIYGSLGNLSLSMAPFERGYGPDDPQGPFVPGFGTHTISHRAVDAAGNRGEPERFTVTVLPGGVPDCTTTVTGAYRGALRVTDGVTCLDGATVTGPVFVSGGGSLVATASTIRGVLWADRADTVQLLDTEVAGSVRITGTTTDVTLAGSRFAGAVTLTGNTQVSANEQFSTFGFAYGPILAGNELLAHLRCRDNSAPVADFGADNLIHGADRCQS